MRGLLLGLLRLHELRTGLRHEPRQLNLDILGQRLLWRRQGHAHLLLDLFAVLERHVLVHVRHDCRCDHLPHGVLPNRLGDVRALHEGHVRGDVRLVILVDEYLLRLASQEPHVLTDGVCW